MGLGAIGLIGTLANTGLQMYGQNQSAKAQMQAAKYNANAGRLSAEYNLKLAENEATNSENQTSEGVKRQRISNRSALADLRNRASSSGLQSTTGASLLVAGESAGRLEIGIQDAVRASAMQAASLRARGRMGLWEADVQGKMGLWEAAQAKSASRIAMLGTAIGGATSAFGQYRTGKYQGLY
jgi:hypothetical protein